MAAQKNWAAAVKFLYSRFSGAMPTAPEYSFDNNKWLQERSADDTANVNMIKIDASNNVVLGPGTNGTVSMNATTLTVPGNLAVAGNATVTANTTFTGSALVLGA